jgi:hypothetical protein
MIVTFALIERASSCCNVASDAAPLLLVERRRGISPTRHHLHDDGRGSRRPQRAPTRACVPRPTTR